MSRPTQPVTWFEAFGYRFGLALDSPDAASLFGRLYAPYRVTSGPGPIFGLTELRPSASGGPVWRVTRDGDEIACRDRFSGALHDLEYAVCAEVIEQRGSRLVLHGATVYAAGGCAFITGVSDAGKTTLTLALAARGYGVGGDDVAFLEPDSNLLWPMPRCAHLDETSKRLLAEAGLSIADPFARQHGFVTPADLGRPDFPAPLRHVFLLGPGVDTEPASTHITQAEATLALLREAGWDNRETPAAFAALARLVSGAECYRLRRGRLDLMVDLVATVIGDPPV